MAEEDSNEEDVEDVEDDDDDNDAWGENPRPLFPIVPRSPAEATFFLFLSATLSSRSKVVSASLGLCWKLRSEREEDEEASFASGASSLDASAAAATAVFLPFLPTMSTSCLLTPRGISRRC